MDNLKQKIAELKEKHKAAWNHGFATAYAVSAEAIALAESLAAEILKDKNDEN